jgi:hypothetical protein
MRFARARRGHVSLSALSVSLVVIGNKTCAYSATKFRELED